MYKLERVNLYVKVKLLVESRVSREGSTTAIGGRRDPSKNKINWVK